MDNCTFYAAMFTRRLVLLGLILFSMGVESRTYTLCCQKDIFSGDKWTCDHVPSRAMEIHGFLRDATARFHGLPQCDDPEDITIGLFIDFVEIDHEVPFCIQMHKRITGQVITVVHCQFNKDRQVETIDTLSFLPPLPYVKKCCPRGTLFDRRTKACVPRLNESESLVTFLQNRSADLNVIVVSEGPPTCAGPIVDYEIEEDDIFLRNGTYSVMIPAFENDAVVQEEVFIAENNACLDTMPDSASNRRLLARVCKGPEFCKRNACVRKCCAENEFFYAKGCSKLAVPEEPTEFHEALASAVNQTELSTFNISKDYGVLIGKPCKHGMYPVDLEEEEWRLMSEGHVAVDGYQLYQQNDYCMDIFYKKSEFDHAFNLFICFDDSVTEEQVPMRYQVNIVLEIISSIFLLITLLVYMCLPNLQNLHGKTLMCHVGSLFLAYVCLVVISWITPCGVSDEQEQKAMITCKVLAYSMLFWFLSSFSWLNVMCFDIWWTFGVLRGSTITKTREQRKRFLLYCLYTWGFSLLMTTLVIVADCTDILPDSLQPNIGRKSCWFTQDPDSYSEVTFFIGPVSIQLMSNAVFFILTLVHCNKVKSEIKRVTTDPADPRCKRFHSDRNRFLMNVKLFIVMGISWGCEVISFLLRKYSNYSLDAFFYVSDVFNCLQGLLIFILFVLKLRVYVALRRRLGLDTKKKPTPTRNAIANLQDPYKVRKSVSSSTLTSTFVISSAP